MSIWLPVSLALVLFLQPAAPPTGSHPQFSGTWRLDPARSASASESDSTDALLVEIQQTDRDLTIVTTQGPRRQQAVYGFVASQATPYSIDGTTSRAYWTGPALVTEGTRLVQGQTVAARETRTLNAAGTEMSVDVVVIVEHGYQTRGGRNYGMGRDVYTRVTP